MLDKVRAHSIFHYLAVASKMIIKGIINSITWFLIAFIGFFIFQSKKSPFDLLFGLPLFLIGLGFAINSLWSIVLSIFSPVYNKAVCFICDLLKIKRK